MSGKTNRGVFNPKNLSLFSYTANNPINLVDPDGKAWSLAAEVGALALFVGYKVHKAKKIAAKGQQASLMARIAKVNATNLYLDRPENKRPKNGGTVISAIVEEAATGKSISGNGKYHGKKGYAMGQALSKIKEEAYKSKLMTKKKKRKVYGAANLLLKPLKSAVSGFKKSPLVPAREKPKKNIKDTYTIKRIK